MITVTASANNCTPRKLFSSLLTRAPAVGGSARANNMPIPKPVHSPWARDLPVLRRKARHKGAEDDHGRTEQGRVLRAVDAYSRRASP